MFIALGAVLFMALNVQAQTPPSIKSNDRYEKGVLDNGLTYYIYSTDVKEDRASFYMIQNVGSILENDDQKGLAHFLEHMAFNGTENFEGKGILNTLQNYGAVFGKNINAYTSFDETVYNINDIPVKEEAVLDTCLLVLHDWSDYLSLTETEIDAERGVVNEEWRTRQNGQMRIMMEQAPIRLNHSKYAERFPIGEMDIVQNFDYETLRDFYHDWYRTDLQAIAVIGDVDVELVRGKIEKLFGGIKAIDAPLERKEYKIDDNETLNYSMAMDKEVPYVSIQYLDRSMKNKAVVGQQKVIADLVQNMVIQMFNGRLQELAQKADTPYIGAGMSEGSYSRNNNTFSLYVRPKKDMQLAAFDTVMKELYSAKKYGFTGAEIDRSKKAVISRYESYLNRIDELSHAEIANAIQSNYLENEDLNDPEAEFELVKMVLSQVPAGAFQQFINMMFDDKSVTLLVTGVEAEKNLSEVDAVAVIEGYKAGNGLKEFKDDFEGKTLMTGVEVVDGSIVSETKNESLGSTTYVLGNGIKVHYKYTDKNVNQVNVRALSYGGKSLVSDDDLISADYAVTIASRSGLNEYTATDLQKVLTGTTARVGLGIGGITESVNGSSLNKDFETAMQLIYLKLEKPRFDQESYDILKTTFVQIVERRASDINAKKQDTLSSILYGVNNPRRPKIDMDYVNSISLEAAQEVYKTRFANPADFEFYIVGDIQEDVVKKMISMYLGSLKTDASAPKEQYLDKEVKLISDKIDQKVALEMEVPKGSVYIGMESEYAYSLKNDILNQMLADLLDLRLTETLREEEGGTYGAGVSGGMSKRPNEEASLSVFFDCEPEKVESLTAIVYQELEKLSSGDVLDNDLEKTRSNYLKEREEAKEKNSFDMNRLVNFYREGYDMNDPANYEDIVKSIEAKDIAKFAKKAFKKGDKYQVIFVPKS